LRHLPEYTGSTTAIDTLRESVVFADAARRALHLAKITKRFTEAQAMTEEQYLAAATALRDPTSRLLLHLCWAFAARVEIHGKDIVFGNTNVHGRQTLHVTFRYGKGAAFWGPYTIATNVNVAVGKDLATLIRTRRKDSVLFLPTEQQALSRAVHEGGNLDVRSIRRGRLQDLAAKGVTTEELRLLSGHRRQDTLLRYLGWGRWAAEGRVRIHEPDSTWTISTMKLTRLPMGAQYAPATAQYLTSPS
jgi:hypothetical protein